MFRSNLEGVSSSDSFPAFHGGLNMLGLQDMYLDTSTPNSAHLSPMPLSPPITPLTSEPPSPSPFSAPSHFPMLTDNNNGNGNGIGNGNMSSLLLQRQYHYHLLLQHQQQLALAQQHLALAASAAAATANHPQPKDEIANSLKMFALLTACNADNGMGSRQDVMQEFAANGYASDDFNRYGNHSPAPTAAASQQRQMAAAPPPLAAAHWLSLNSYREQLNNMWRSMSYCHMPNLNLTANAAAAAINASSAVNSNNNNINVNIPTEHMRSNNNSGGNNNNNNKMPKRHIGNKGKETNRHCVFCENNNEPEAVVNSHTVRDNLGRVLCPKLRTYVCPICKASGDSAHTIKYCPKKPIITMEDAIKAESFRLAKSTYYKQQMKV